MRGDLYQRAIAPGSRFAQFIEGGHPQAPEIVANILRSEAASAVSHAADNV